MTNVEFQGRTANNADRKIMFGYLTVNFSSQFGYARRVSERLNAKGVRSVMEKEYTPNIVYQVVDKGANDFHVERTLVELNEEYFGKPIAEICPNYVPTYNAALLLNAPQ